MIRDIAVGLAERLKERKCPVPVITPGAEPTQTTTGARERIVVEYDYDGSDTFEFVRSQRQNPKHVVTDKVAAKITIYAQSVKSGAMLFEHERRAKRILKSVLASLDVVARGDLKTMWSPTTGHFIRPPDLDASAKLPGAVYELKFTVGEAVRDVTFEDEAKPEMAITEGLIASTTNVSLENAPEGSPVVTGCGGNDG